MNRNISGINVPKEIIFRMRKASNPMEEGLSIASEAISELVKFRAESYYAYGVS